VGSGNCSYAEPVQLDTPPSLGQLEGGKRYIRSYDELKNWRGKQMQYVITLPPRFDPERRYPILFEWPGKGGSSRTRVFLDNYRVHGHIHVGLNYAKGNDDGTGPLYPNEKYATFLRHVYEDVTSHFAGHPDYLFIGGFSAGEFMAAGPGIGLIMHADLRDQLAGVLAGGCHWKCDPRYAARQNVFLWYAEGDTNSSGFSRHVPELRKYTKHLIIVRRPDGAHRPIEAVEGPVIRRFLGIHGLEREAFRRLLRIERRFEHGELREADHNWARQLARRPSQAGAHARQLLDQFDARP